MFVAVLIFILLVGIYWGTRRLSAQEYRGSALSYPLLVLILCGVLIIAYIHSMDRTYMQDDTPILVTLAVDLSLSMDAIPDPREYEGVGTRMERAQRVLLPILEAMEASDANVMLSITGFTVGSEIIAGWDNNLSQAREVIDYVIAPGLLTEPGTDMGVALQGVLPLIDNLPAQYQEGDNRKILIVVSDGEQTIQKGDMITALSDLREKGVDIIALQVGMEDTPEGLPVFDESDEFMGFQDVGGQIYTIPDPKTMLLIAGEDSDRGLYVRAETSNATRLISDFLGLRMSGAESSNPIYLGGVIALWALSFAILLWFI